MRNKFRYSTRVVKCHSAEAAIFHDSSSGGQSCISLDPSAIAVLTLNSQIRLEWEPRSEEVKANSRLLSSALCLFRYTIMSPCFSMISSKLETVLQRIKILMGYTHSPILLSLFASGSQPVENWWKYSILHLFSFCSSCKPGQYPKWDSFIWLGFTTADRK